MIRTVGKSILTGRNYAYSLPGITIDGRSNVVLKWKRPFSGWNYKTVPANIGYYDSAPGSQQRVAGDAADLTSVLVADRNYDTFMPVTSTLDVQDAGSIYSPNFGYNVSQQIRETTKPNRAKYAFDAYFAAGGVNEPHVQITNGQASTTGNPSFFTDNTRWLQNELRESEHRVPASLTSASLNYNFGSLYRRLLPSVYVSNGGRLYVNNAGLPVSGGTPATQANPVEANFEMYTSNCGTLVQLWPDGQLVLGQPNSDKKATVRFANKSVLDMRWAGQTIVNAGSTLVIQRGATLLVRDGGILNIYGTVIVEAGATSASSATPT